MSHFEVSQRVTIDGFLSYYRGGLLNFYFAFSPSVSHVNLLEIVKSSLKLAD